MKKYEVFYNDGIHYGTMTFEGMSQAAIETDIQEEISRNNKNPNPLYHITRENFEEIK